MLFLKIYCCFETICHRAYKLSTKLTNPYDVKTSGDARRALDICRRAAELAQRDVINGNVVATKSPRKTPSKKNLSSNSLVQLKHVNLAHQVNSIQM